MTAIHLAFFALEIILAGFFAHRAVPSVLSTGKLAAIKMLMLALTLAFAGIGQLTLAVNGEEHRSGLLFGHVTLIAYCAISYWQLWKLGFRSWLKEGRN